MDKEKRKELMNSYKNRAIIGGVYCIKCSGNGREWLRSTTDLEGAKNRFSFSMKMKGAPEPSMVRECSEYGWESFSFNVLQELQKEDTQTDKEFADDIAALFEICIENSGNGNLG